MRHSRHCAAGNLLNCAPGQADGPADAPPPARGRPQLRKSRPLLDAGVFTCAGGCQLRLCGAERHGASNRQRGAVCRRWRLRWRQTAARNAATPLHGCVLVSFPLLATAWMRGTGLSRVCQSWLPVWLLPGACRHFIAGLLFRVYNVLQVASATIQLHPRYGQSVAALEIVDKAAPLIIAAFVYVQMEHQAVRTTIFVHVTESRLGRRANDGMNIAPSIHQKT